jgi:hypothetical protein
VPEAKSPIRVVVRAVYGKLQDATPHGAPRRRNDVGADRMARDDRRIAIGMIAIVIAELSRGAEDSSRPNPRARLI